MVQYSPIISQYLFTKRTQTNIESQSCKERTMEISGGNWLDLRII